MAETRKLAAILAADVVGYSRLAGADEDRTLARLRTLRSDLIDPTVSVHNGRVVKRTGDGSLVEFRSVVDAVRCAVEVQNGMVERNAGLPPERRIEFRVGIHLGDVVEESDGDLMGDGINIAARLEGVAKPGGICLSYAAYEQVRDKLKEEFIDLGEQSLKNIARPVRVYGVTLNRSAANSEQVAPASHSGTLALPDKPSIAVLPFQNMSGDSEQEYFVDGMVEDIITGLSRIKWLFVIARNSSFAYKGKSPDIRQVGRELGVRYVLEGSVRKAENRVRISAELIEAQAGAHLWAERYDRTLDDIFALQDEITSSVVGAIEPSLRSAEVERVKRKRPESLDAYDLYLRALSCSSNTTPAAATLALEYLETALRIGQSYPAAHGLAAICHYRRFIRSSAGPEEKSAAVHHARAVLASGPDDATALAQAAFVLHAIGDDTPTARSALDSAIVLNPNSAQVIAYSAIVNADLGHYETAIEEAQRSIRLSPFDPMLFRAEMALTVAYYYSGRFTEAAEAAMRAIRSNPQFTPAHAFLAASCHQLGHIADARMAVKRLLEVEPSFRVNVLQRRAFGAAADMEGLFAALHAAGLD
jgi:adenylate cyclase